MIKLKLILIAFLLNITTMALPINITPLTLVKEGATILITTAEGEKVLTEIKSAGNDGDIVTLKTDNQTVTFAFTPLPAGAKQGFTTAADFARFMGRGAPAGGATNPDQVLYKEISLDGLGAVFNFGDSDGSVTPVSFRAEFPGQPVLLTQFSLVMSDQQAFQDDGFGAQLTPLVNGCLINVGGKLLYDFKTNLALSLTGAVVNLPFFAAEGNQLAVIAKFNPGLLIPDGSSVEFLIRDTFVGAVDRGYGFATARKV